MSKLLTGLCIFFVALTLLYSYWAEGTRTKQSRESAVNTKVIPTKAATEKTTLHPMVASTVVEFIEVATVQTPSKMLPVALATSSDLPADPPKKGVTVKVYGNGRVSVLNDCPTAKPEPYENPDGDGEAYQVDVPLGFVYEVPWLSFVLSH